MTDEIQPVLTPRAAPEDVVALARTPQEMAVAQQGLIAWADAKIARLQAALAEVRENLELAKKHKWKQAGWIRQVKLAEQRVTYYQKVKAALEEGYCIMPDLPVQLLAVRTDAKRPKHQIAKSSYSHPEHKLDNVQAKELPTGEGRYVDKRTYVERWSETTTDKAGRDVITNYARPTIFDTAIDFPMKLVKPQILDDTGKALALKIFDEIGILPQKSRRGLTAMATSDPVVVGRIIHREGYNRHAISFLISWWVDTSQL